MVNMQQKYKNFTPQLNSVDKSTLRKLPLN